MECGSETLCQALTWLTENELAARKLNDLLIKLGQGSTGGIGAVAQFLKDYGQLIVGLLGFSFGAWRWWLYHERVLHKRLDDYISARDARLKDVRSKALETIQRPAPGQTAQAPSFIDRELASVLRENQWGNTTLALSVNSSAEWQLSKAVENIKRKLQIAEREAVSLRQELCTAYGLRGAVASARAGAERHATALTYFRNALSLPGHANDIQLKELEAHQLRKLGHFVAAEVAYERVIELARDLHSERDRNVIVARAKRYLAEIDAKPWNAYLRMRADADGGQYSPGPIALLDRCQPLSSWEWIEKGDMHYFTALLARLRDYNNVEGQSLEDADAAFQAALLAIRTRRWNIGKSSSGLRNRIRDGRERVRRARDQKIYDMAWWPRTPSGLDEPQTPTAKVSGSGSSQPVPETA
jgi:tetratricopeptide (TPR) repeat protein